MERQVLLAFALSLAVFIGWGAFISTMQPPPKVQDATQKSGSNSSPATASRTAPGQSSDSGATSHSPVVPPVEEKLVSISTGIATLEFSSLGGILKNARLNKYLETDGTPVDLIRHGEGNKAPLTIESNNETVNEILRNSQYEITPETLELSEANPQGQITIKLEHESGLSVTRIVKFTYGKYLVEIDTSISNPQRAAENLQYFNLLGPGLGGAANSQTDYIVFSGATSFINGERIESPPDEIPDITFTKGDISWTGFQNKYFAAALIPERGAKSAVVKKEGENVYVGLEFEAVQSAAHATFALYAGTKELQILEATGHNMIRVLDYGWFGNKFAFLVKPLLKVLQYFYGILHNYGWAIIVLTLIIKLLFFPLTHKSFKSMKGMHKIQPYVKVIQERNKGDRSKMNEELLELYKKHRVNPLGGCLPMLLQIPVFIGLYHALFFSIELRGAPFILWIEDLSVADPYYVTPIMMGATMFFQQKLSPQIGDPMQQKILMFLPILFTFLFLSFPAGLVIYWTVNNILTISQQFYIYKIAKD
ncbi:MAG: membrane protein insertase YidC [Candidatus Nitrohelix vancouverensis]|uniref:Membrane protein insertase YidC n=1 Tax=Candidatus Nitrohelix vancouverensis TaxID=2705534 RepID=A0A7T0C0Q1_9BACT|nr:MAG: membrane protein insertase YidC [Candidatus Nitrohelix vancouverensis]